MNLTTTYLGFTLPHPLMPGASPLVDDLDMVRRLEDAGAAAIVMHSLFEEQIAAEEHAAGHLAAHGDSFGEALSYLPAPPPFALGPDRYLEQLRRIREAVAVPVIASLNGVTASGWLEYARLLEQAGAHALELNVYHVPTDAAETAAAVEARVLDVLRAVRAAVRLPLAVKLSPFYSALAHFARRARRRSAPTASSSSTASTSPTSIPRRSRSSRRSSSPTRRSCACGCAGSRSCRSTCTPRSRRAAVSTPAWTP